MTPDGVIVAGGSGRAGSTLIGEVLAAATGRTMLGEVALFWRALDEGLSCGCGRGLADCSFWSNVLDRLTRTDAEHAATVHGQFRSVMQSSLRPYRRRAEAPAWRSAHVELLDAIGQCASAGHVDSSKQLPHLELVATAAPTGNRYVHLTRDPRAVAYSWAHSKPIPGENNRPMRTMTASRSTLAWLLHNRGQRALAPRFARRCATSYERFCDDPAGFVTDVVDALDDRHRLDRGVLEDLEARRFGAVPTHALAGNPGRAGGPPTTIRRDDRWVTGLRGTDALIVWALGGMEARRYGYRFRDRAVSADAVGAD